MEKLTLAEVMSEALDSRALEIHTALPAVVKRYDAEAQEVDALPAVHQPVPLKSGGIATEELPLITGVPVVWPRAGGCYLHFPMDVGDHVLLVFSEGSFAQWYQGIDKGKDTAPPGDLRRHSLTSPFAIPGVARKRDPLPDAPASGEVVLVVADGVTVRISSAGGSAELVAEGPKVNAELAAIKSMLSTWIGAMNTWLGLWPGDPGAAALTAVQPGAATLATATGSLASSLGSWPSGSVEVSKLKAE